MKWAYFRKTNGINSRGSQTRLGEMKEKLKSARGKEKRHNQQFEEGAVGTGGCLEGGRRMKLTQKGRGTWGGTGPLGDCQ